MTFLTPAGYKATIPANIPHIDGSILIASARPQGFLDEQDPDVIRYNATLLLDPQLYLSDIDPNSCSVKCANLASYGWFDVGEMSKARSGGYRGVQRYQKKLQGSIADHWKGLPGADDINAAVAVS